MHSKICNLVLKISHHTSTRRLILECIYTKVECKNHFPKKEERIDLEIHLLLRLCLLFKMYEVSVSGTCAVSLAIELNESTTCHTTSRLLYRSPCNVACYKLINFLEFLRFYLLETMFPKQIGWNLLLCPC